MTHSFKLLKELLSHLSRKEIALLKKKINSNPEKEVARNSKSKHLVNLLISSPEITSANAEKKVYGDGNKIAYSKLIDRIIDRIDEIYMSFGNDTSEFKSERNYYFFSLKRKLLVLQMRWLRGIDYDLGLQFEKIIAISKKYELYEILIETLHAKQRFMGFRFGNSAFDKIEKEIIQFEHYRQVGQRARSLFTKIGSRIANSNYSSQHLIELESAISELKKDYTNTNSASVRYYLLYLQVEWFQIHNKYLESKKILSELLEFVLKNPSVFTKARQGDVILNLTNVELKLGNFNEALRYIISAHNFYEKESVPYNLVMEQTFYCHFYLKEFDVADELIRLTFKSSRSSNIPFRYSKYAYLYACIKTIKGEIEKSNELLLEAKEIERNKGGWNIAKRILTIINCIEAQDHERADLQVMNLEKFVKRNSKLHHVRKRDILILRILLKLINEGFDFDKVYKSRKRYFDLLESTDPEYAWKIKSPELIVFHEWFRKKMTA